MDSVISNKQNYQSLTTQVDRLRLQASRDVSQAHKSDVGQFLTPAPMARLMASMAIFSRERVAILDAGAGVGTLFAACVEELCQREVKPKEIYVTTYEVDRALIPYLSETFQICRQYCHLAGVTFDGVIYCQDFIEAASDLLDDTLFSVSEKPRFDCAILNPPYRKINSDSRHRRLLRTIGIETSNLYTAFVAIAARLLAPQGEIVAITPRSYCNGPYFRSFREDLLKTVTLKQLHLFDSRKEAFQEDRVLQENIILHAVKGQTQSEDVIITASSDAEAEFALTRKVAYEKIIHPQDPQSFIHIISDDLEHGISEQMTTFQKSLSELGLAVSTGRVVDFRAHDFLREHPDSLTGPLIYPIHFVNGYVAWPKSESKKPNALIANKSTESLFVPNDNYVLVKRFSTKEEKKRIVAAVYDATRIPGDIVGFENHLNYFHCNGRGLDLPLARGLAAFLNSTIVDSYFRQFNGHTQVNATDLRNIKYPTLEQLTQMGSSEHLDLSSQVSIDTLIETNLLSHTDLGKRNPLRMKKKIEEALIILKALGMPREQQNERSALTLLALLNLQPEMSWIEAEAPLCGITPMMDFFSEHYGKEYKPNTRETVRRQTVHQFLEAGLVVLNPDEPLRPTNSPKAVYQIEEGALSLIRAFGGEEWEPTLKTYLASTETLQSRYAYQRNMRRIPITIGEGQTISLSPGGQNVLVEKVLTEFAERHTPGAKPLYIGDTDDKFAYYDQQSLTELGVVMDSHGKMPDVILHFLEKNWLVLIEAVTSHGPINPKRHQELKKLFQDSSIGLVFVTTFLTRKAMMYYLDDISWETEVWTADHPEHMIHFNGERFLGPYEAKKRGSV